jgi:hypothetical protein
MLKLTASLNQAISQYYLNDPSSPSLITSYLPKNGEWYFSIVRYSHKFGGGKYLVLNGKGRDYVEGLKELATNWLQSIGNVTSSAELSRLQKILSEKP